MNEKDLTPMTAELADVYGEQFVQYALNVEMTIRDLDVNQLSHGQLEVLQFLATQLRSLDRSDKTGFGTVHSLAGLSTYVAEHETSLVNLLRQTAGGTLPKDTSSTDGVLQPLQELARDIWPAYLLPPPPDGPKTFWMSTPVGMFQHPALTKAAKAILADPALSRLFPGDPLETDGQNSEFSTLVGYQSLIYSTSGRGGSLQLLGLIGSMISDAIFRTLLKTPNLSWPSLKEQLSNTVTDVRLLATGKTAHTPIIIGFHGVKIPEGNSITLGQGLLRAPTQVERDLFLSSAGSLTAVFETTFSLKLVSITEHVLTDPDQDPVWDKAQPRMEEARRTFRRAIDLVRMALLLASTNDEPWVAQEMGSYMADPLHAGGVVTWDSNYSTAVSFEFAADKQEELRLWHQLLSTKHVSSLDVGMRRLLSATTTRTDPIDAFVDSVIVWENIFGVQTETAFRVTGSIAKLLEPRDAAKRRALHAELKKLYEKRSRLVHGGQEPAPQGLWSLRQRGIAVAADCFRALFEERPELLNMASHERGAHLLLE